MRTRLACQINTGIFQLKVNHCTRVCAEWHSGEGIDREDCLRCCSHFVKAEPSRVNPGFNWIHCTASEEELVALALMED